MASPIGLGLYQGAPRQDYGLGLYLAHLCPETAADVRAREPQAFILGRFDQGKDSEQVNWQSDGPEGEADRFFAEKIAPVVRAWPGVYSAIGGPNEAYPGRPQSGPLGAYHDALAWRSRLELRLCRRIQRELGLPYVWGAVSVGCLEAEDLPIFGDVLRESWATNYHAYPIDGRVESQESDPWYLWRPLKLWLPMLRAMGVRLRLVLGECGPFAPTLHGADLARCQIAIHRAFRAACQALGDIVEYVGAIAYGRGLLGDQAPWELAGCEGMFAAANAEDHAVAPLVPAPSDEADSQGGQTVSDYYSTNHDGPRSVTTGIVVHSTRGGAVTPQAEYAAAVRWLGDRTSGVSAHAVIGPNGEVARPVHPDNIAWHCRTRNRTHLGIEFTQARIGDVVNDAMLQAGARVCAEWCVKFGIPTAWALDRGFVQHKDTPEGHADGKSDIGAGFDGDRFMELVRAEVARLTVDPVTDALNGVWHFATQVEAAGSLEAARAAATSLKSEVVELKAALGK